MTVATCTLNQWALDFDGNLERIHESCKQAKNAGATYRLGPELEICGYGCEDHFLEKDTIDHSWQSLVALLTQTESTVGMICDFGMPILGNDGCRYNCRVVCHNRTIVWIRPKTHMADDGNYRESRYFTAYDCGDGSGSTGSKTKMYSLPYWVRDQLRAGGVPDHPSSVPLGGAGSYLRTDDGVAIGCESCEELWVPNPSHVGLALKGVEIIGNGSGSHHELRKLDKRLELMVAATAKNGGVYLYSNQRGCDGGRLYYDGGAIIVCNGKVLAQSPQFCLRDVVVVTATVDLDEVRSFRASKPSFSRQVQQHHTQEGGDGSSGGNGTVVRVAGARVLSSPADAPSVSKPIRLAWSKPEEECCLGPACWLWDYLRRSGASGYLLPLSGGADSSAVATIVMAMCHLVYDEAVGITSGDSDDEDDEPNEQVLRDLRRICGGGDYEFWLPNSPQDIASHILHTVFMGTENSSQNTTDRAQRLGEAIGSYHLTVPIDLMVTAVVKVFALATGQTPRFVVRGGTLAEDLALQNIQARLRMVTAYLFAQLLPWTRLAAGQNVGKGFLLVLGSANVDEGLRGYMTKYDCSSADLNPIGAISKGDLKRMLLWASEAYGTRSSAILREIAGAPPTAELRPNSGGENGDNGDNEHSQLDEEEMGMTYDELGWFGRLRKLGRCGPVSMYRKLVAEWTTDGKNKNKKNKKSKRTPRPSETLTHAEVAAKVKRFFYYYSINRHKMCTLTPSYHAEGYSPDDNRFDLRPFLYNSRWPRQFQTIDQLVEEYERNSADEGHRTENKFLER